MGRKSLSQYFLKNEEAARKIAEAVVGIEEETSSVLEIGGGSGILTEALYRCGAVLKTVEIDSRLAEGLRRRYATAGGGPIVNSDIFDIDLDALCGGKRINLCGNIPYHISGRILRWISENHKYFAIVVLMVQEEVGRRVCGQPGVRDYGILSIVLGIDFLNEYLFKVSAREFSPSPKVDSSVIKLIHRERKLIEDKDREAFFLLVKKAFSKRRKKLYNSLDGFGGNDSSAVIDKIKAVGLDGNLRAEMLSVNDYINLFREFQR